MSDQIVQKPEAACAEMRHFLIQLRYELLNNAGYTESDYERLDGTIGNSLLQRRISLLKLSKHALSTDCGKGWRSPQEWDALETKWTQARTFAAWIVSEWEKHKSWNVSALVEGARKLCQ